MGRLLICSRTRPLKPRKSTCRRMRRTPKPTGQRLFLNWKTTQISAACCDLRQEASRPPVIPKCSNKPSRDLAFRGYVSPLKGAWAKCRSHIERHRAVCLAQDLKRVWWQSADRGRYSDFGADTSDSWH